MNFHDYLSKNIENHQIQTNQNLSSKFTNNNNHPIIQDNQYNNSIRKFRNDPIEYLNELRQKLVYKIKKQWLTPNRNKEYLSVSQITSCPLQTWYILTGIIKDEDIEEEKIFYLLEIYGRIGDLVHEQIYKLLDLEHTEKTLYDKKHYLKGRFDIIDSNMLIDIKSTNNESNVKDYIPQLALYYHLAIINNYTIDRVLVWLVMRDKIIELDIDHLKKIIPIYLDVSVNLKRSLEILTPPKYMNSNSCKYCLVKNFCSNFINENKLNLIDLSNVDNANTDKNNSPDNQDLDNIDNSIVNNNNKSISFEL